MTNTIAFSKWLAGLAGGALALAIATPALAQQTSPADDKIETSEEIVVIGEIAYRNRTSGNEPVLEYGLDYFQRFEPLTVGDALKRVPSVAFLSDVLESDGVRLRGLDPAYTQILINGEQVPGSGSGSGGFGNGVEASFFVDRIPAELIERIEIVRAPSASRSGDAMAGAINIILRDGYSLEGGYVRGGLMHFRNDEAWRETLGGVWGGAFAGGRLLVGANLQDRHNPKDKLSLRFDEPGADLNDVEVQTDVRDGTDYSANFSFVRDLMGGELTLDGFWVKTDRFEDEDSVEFEEGVIEEDAIISLNDNNVQIDQTSYTLGAGYVRSLFGGKTKFRVSYAKFTNEEDEFEDETGFGGGDFPFAEEFASQNTRVDQDDRELKLKVSHARELAQDVELTFGADYERKERDSLVLESEEIELEFDPTIRAVAARPTGIVIPGIGDFEAVTGGDTTIERTRFDPFVKLAGRNGPLSWEGGLRYETTDISIVDRTDSNASISNDYQILLPSGHLRWDLNERARLSFSLARTVRNPSFNFLSPAVLEAELGDNDFVGNSRLNPETAWGVDAGFERRLGKDGIFGVNLFWRDVSDLIEVYNTGAEGSEGEDTFVYSARNSGDGKVWGIEFDLSAPLTVFGLNNTGVFLNYSWLDSETKDEFGERRFNDQAESILNVGFIQELPTLGASFGASYRKQGDAMSRFVAEEVTTSYDGDLEVFLEKTIGKRFVVRLTGSNLLDAAKEEVFNKFDTTGDQIDRSFDEYEIERETAGPVFQLIGRYAF